MALENIESAEYRKYSLEYGTVDHKELGEGYTVSVAQNGKVLAKSGFAGKTPYEAEKEGQRMVDRIHEAPFDT